MSTAHTPPTMTVIVVDDSASVRQQFEFTLTQAGMNVETFETAEAALRRVRCVDHGVDAAVVDLKLPGMDGLSLTKLLRQSDTWSWRPIIVCSTTSDPRTLRAAKRFGVDGWAVKPFEPRRFIKSLQDVFNRKSQDAAHEAMRPAPVRGLVSP